VTIHEMHIAVNLGVQKIASFQVDNFLPQEIDHELNTAMDRFINKRYAPKGNKYVKGFEQSQKRIDDLRHLVVNSTLETFSDGEVQYGGDSKTFFTDRATLPTDYLFLVNIRAVVNDACTPQTFELAQEVNKFQRIDLTPPQRGYILTHIISVLDSYPVVILTNSSGLTLDQILDSNNYAQNCCIPSLSIESTTVSGTVEQTPTTDGNEVYLKVNVENFTGTIQTALRGPIQLPAN
jgi:hypothetical protein